MDGLPPTNLSVDQTAAIERIISFVEEDTPDAVGALSGPAGSGKTTIVRALVARLQEIDRHAFLVAPTGRAARRLSQLTGARASTIHGAIYKRVGEERKTHRLLFGDATTPAEIGTDSVIICDEASMVGRKLHADLHRVLPESVPLLYVGDPYQLPPVADERAADFDHPVAALESVHRQALGSPIIRLATAIRLRDATVMGEMASDLIQSGPAAFAAEWLADRRRSGVDAVLITFRNALRHELNAAVRLELGLTRYPLRIAPGDDLLVRLNSRVVGRMNGDVVRVARVEDFGGGNIAVWPEDTPDRPFIVHADLLFAEVYQFQDFIRQKVVPLLTAAQHRAIFARLGYHSTIGGAHSLWLHCHYGHCLTVHAAQGNQWQEVGFVVDRVSTAKFTSKNEAEREFGLQLFYTGVTRAQTSLTIWTVY